MKAVLSLVAAALALCVASLPLVAQDEIGYPKDEFNQLDHFEAHSLGKADKIFYDKDYGRAAAEYDAFILEFPRSAALPYAILRKGRSLQLANKRFNAIKVYNEVLDYFPDRITFAAAALFYIGQCHAQNGAESEAMKAWAEMADDDDYNQHYLAAYAINQLAGYLAAKEQVAKAMEYYWQVASDFRRKNEDAANAAIWKVVPYYMRTKPDEAKLREFYQEVGSFERRPEKIEENFADDGRYWDRVRRYVQQFGDFNDVQAVQRRSYYQYWANAMAGRFEKWDDYQIDLARYRLYAGGERDAYVARLDEQYEKYQEAENFSRTIKWMGLFASDREKVKSYYAKLDFDKMSPAQTQEVLRFFYDQLKDVELARNVFDKLRLDKLDDKAKYELERYLWQRDGALVERVCQAFTNPEYGKLELLRYHHWRRAIAPALALADELINVPDYAKEVTWKKAELLQWSRKFEDAIRYYQQADNAPDNLFRIAECFVGLGKPDAAIGQLKEIENFFKDKAATAALIIAHIYRDRGDREHYVATLRGIMNKYKQSGESSTAHQELEKLGERIGGGEDAN